jgi:hypothetical protein
VTLDEVIGLLTAARVELPGDTPVTIDHAGGRRRVRRDLVAVEVLAQPDEVVLT